MAVETPASTTTRTGDADVPTLRRTLRLWQVIGLSVGLMAPSMAISINPQGAVGAVGRAIPLSFVISLVGALLVAYGFSRLSQHFHNSGSVLGLVGATLGARAGVVAGWCLAGTYVLFALLTGVTAGIYGGQFLQAVGVTSSDPAWLQYLIGGVAILLGGALAGIPAERATEVILSFEGVTLVLIVVGAAVVVAKLAGHSGPGHLGLTLSVFTPAKGTTTSNVFLGVVFGFLSFGGFESSATLGGEALHPRRDIPRALIITVTVIGAFYVLISAVEVMGFGTSDAGLKDFAASPALMGTLGERYVASWFGDLIILGTVVSAFGCTMASCVGASRLVYSFARDGLAPTHSLARLSTRWATPVAAVGLVVAIEVVIEVAFGLIGTTPLNVFAYTGEIGTLLILVAYGLVTIGAAAFLFVGPMLRREATRSAAAELVLPVAGIALLAYTVYRNVVPYPTGPARWLPVVSGVWLALSLAFVALAPASSRRLGQRLVDEEAVEVVDVR